MSYAYYVYYRVDPEQARAAEPRIRELFAGVERVTGVPGRLMKKRDEPLLWMEVYENVADDAKFERELADAVAGHGIAGFLLAGSTRHAECFEL